MHEREPDLTPRLRRRGAGHHCPRGTLFQTQSEPWREHDRWLVREISAVLAAGAAATHSVPDTDVHHSHRRSAAESSFSEATISRDGARSPGGSLMTFAGHDSPVDDGRLRRVDAFLAAKSRTLMCSCASSFWLRFETESASLDPAPAKAVTRASAGRAPECQSSRRCRTPRHDGARPGTAQMFGVNYFCRFGATILAGSARRHGRPGRPRPGRAARPITANLSGGTDGVSPERAGALAEDARSALTRRPARRYAVRSGEQDGRSDAGRPGVHEADRRRARGRSGPGARPREAGAGGDFRRDRSVR